MKFKFITFEPHIKSIRKKTTRYYTIKQVTIIFQKLGEP